MAIIFTLNINSTYQVTPILCKLSNALHNNNPFRLYSDMALVSISPPLQNHSFQCRFNGFHTNNLSEIEQFFKAKMQNFLIASDLHHHLSIVSMENIYVHSDEFAKIPYIRDKYRLPNFSIESINRGLRQAAASGEINDLKWFLDVADIDINAKGHDGKTALEWAAFNYHFPCVELLIKAGANTENCYDVNNLINTETQSPKRRRYY